MRSPPSALVESVVKPRVPHRGFSKILLKPASFAGFHRIGTFHSAPCFGILPTTNSEFPLCQGGDFSFNPTFGNNEMRILSRPRGRGYILAPLRLAPLHGSIRMISV